MVKYQEWRRGGDIEPPDPKELGKVLDEVIELLKEQARRPHRGREGAPKTSQTKRALHTSETNLNASERHTRA